MGVAAALRAVASSMGSAHSQHWRRRELQGGGVGGQGFGAMEVLTFFRLFVVLFKIFQKIFHPMLR